MPDSCLGAKRHNDGGEEWGVNTVKIGFEQCLSTTTQETNPLGFLGNEHQIPNATLLSSDEAADTVTGVIK